MSSARQQEAGCHRWARTPGHSPFLRRWGTRLLSGWWKGWMRSTSYSGSLQSLRTAESWLRSLLTHPAMPLLGSLWRAMALLSLTTTPLLTDTDEG